MHVNCILLAFSEYGTSEISTKLFNFLVPDVSFTILKTVYTLLLFFKSIRNVRVFVHDILITLIHYYDLWIKRGPLLSGM